MGSTICKNELCAATTSHDWKNGWPLRSGGFANLCFNCGSAYEKSVYCETFHSEETGWRDCSTCGKKIHCGCVVSKSLYDFLDHGGIGCISCTSRSLVFSNNEVHKRLSTGPSDVGSSPSLLFPNRVVGGDDGGLLQLCEAMENNEPNIMPQLPRLGPKESLGQIIKPHEITPENGDVGREFSSAALSSVGSLSFPKPENSRIMALGIEDRRESLAEPSLNMTLGTPTMNSEFVLSLSNGRELGKTPPSLSFEPQRNRPILPKPLKSGIGGSSEPNRGLNSPMRIARPPGDGRGKSQLLPRYWPRITDQELEKLSGAMNSMIVPLFEKVLSASDAGRIGRLVLPKACAEAYFPAIAQSEGLPLKVRDVKGNEWTFQFRFWPNNNSRMYVLEGVTPCIQALKLQAGDTVTFSRIDPGGKLVMGYRKSLNNVDLQDAESYAPTNGFVGESSFGNASEYPENGNGFPKGSKDTLSANGSETNGFRNNGDHSPQIPPEKKKTRNIGSKSKRLHMHSEDVLELRLTWEEAQDLLRPPPTANLNIVTIEDHEFEEYDAPPVFGKRTLVVSRSTGCQEQWAQCDECSKWRRLPVDVLLPAKWACSDNEWDADRGSCSAPEELSLKELENLLRSSRDMKKRRKTEERKSSKREVEGGGQSESGLEALARAAVLGSSGGGEEATTTRHPRHRPGCSCIVCIQPPSGKGKHKPTCTCNVCMTVKRRFKTLMLRKKRRLTNANASANANPNSNSDSKNVEANGNGNGNGNSNSDNKNVEANANANSNSDNKNVEANGNGNGNGNGGGIDLNSHPIREEEPLEQQRQSPFPGEREEDVVMEKVCDEVHNNRINGVFIDPNLK